MTGFDRIDGPMSNDQIRELYERLHIEHGDRSEALDGRPASQPVRFAAVAAAFGGRLPDSIVDLGCGFGDLLAHFRALGWQGRYTGIDFTAQFVEAANRRFRDDGRANFHVADVMSVDLPEKGHDACVSLGLCNYQRVAGTMGFIEELVSRAAFLASTTVIVDFLSATSDRRRDDLFFTEPADALRIGLRHSRRVLIDHTYMPFEFLMKVRLDSATQPGLPFYASPL
ncbi:SAM-dependent methyltransferase [Angulomicrobium tetraedrale]|uniref:SAM-dependent methyltransferase n=1 Tax=Ancylobacter tetraedralis TaxID=217068 RepID=A0A839Z6Z6_9HYPH|nr:class I SAM-dependent methyltransferase [Ancylobacter tetraedralis]MBB3770791.1 SAM-dependent methyltransferase [Ancylobacter tetraedralis]